MRRRLFTLAAAGSLVLCVAVCVLWVRSYWRRDVCSYFSLRLYRMASSNRGVLVFYQRHPQIGPVTDEPSEWSFETYDPYPIATFFGPPRSMFHRAGFRLWRDEASYGLMFPHWCLAVALLVPLAAWYARRHKHREGHCPRCGYDLHATPERCPECGAVPQPAK